MLAQEFCHSGGSTLQECRQRLSKKFTCQSCVYIFSKSMGHESACCNGIVQATNFHSAYTLRNRKAQPLRCRNVEHDDVYRVGGPLRWLLGDSYVTHSRKKHQTSQLSAKAVSQDKKNFQTHAKVSIPTCASCFNDVHQGLSRLNCIIGICMGIQLGPCHGTLKMREVLKMVDILTFLFFVVWGKWICSQFFWKKQQLQNRTGGHSSLGCHVGQPRMHPPSSLQTLVPKQCCNFGDIKRAIDNDARWILHNLVWFIQIHLTKSKIWTIPRGARWTCFQQFHMCVNEVGSALTIKSSSFWSGTKVRPVSVCCALIAHKPLATVYQQLEGTF